MPCAFISASASDEHRVGTDGERVDHHAGLELLHLPHLRGLAFGVEIAVDHADAAGLRHGDRHPRFGHGIHRGGDDGDIERNGAGHAGPDVDFGGQHIREAGFQQHVVEREGFANPLKSPASPLPTPYPRLCCRNNHGDEHSRRRSNRPRRRIDAHRWG